MTITRVSIFSSHSTLMAARQMLVLRSPGSAKMPAAACSSRNLTAVFMYRAGFQSSLIEQPPEVVLVVDHPHVDAALAQLLVQVGLGRGGSLAEPLELHEHRRAHGPPARAVLLRRAYEEPVRPLVEA